MFIKNYSDSDFVIKYNGQEKTLAKKDVTYIDDDWISFPMVQAMFGFHVGEVTGTTPIDDFLFDNQVKPELNTMYKVVKQGPGKPRIFAKDATITLSFSDLKPASMSDMYASSVYTNVDGMIMLDAVPKYIAVTSSGTPSVIFTNIAIEEIV